MSKRLHLYSGLIALAVQPLLASAIDDEANVALGPCGKGAAKAAAPAAVTPAPAAITPVAAATPAQVPSPTNNYPTLLPDETCPDLVRFSADFLYLRPTLDDTYFVLNGGMTAGSSQGQRFNNDFGFKPAFRVGFEGSLCSSKRAFKSFYSYLSGSSSKTVSGSALGATVGSSDVISAFDGYSGNASSDIHLLFQRAEALFTQQILESRGMYFYIQPGLEFAYMRVNEDLTYNSGSSTATVGRKSRAWGVGPELGLAFDYNFYQGQLTCRTTHAFTINSLFSGSLLVGGGRGYNNQTNGSAIANVKDQAAARTIPALHAKVGLNYLIRGSACGFTTTLGYEFNSYIRAIAKGVFTDDVADSAMLTNYYNFDLQGLYVSESISF